MKAIDGLLNIVARQDATELRLASNHPPRLFRGTDELSLTMPATSAEALRTLLGDLIDTHAPVVGERGAPFLYSSEAGEFDVSVIRRTVGGEAELDVRFVRRSVKAPARSTIASVGQAVSAPAAIGAVLAKAVELGASDVHLTQGRAPIVRVGGELRSLRGVEPPDIAAMLPERGQLERVLAGRAIDLGLDVPNVGRLRVNVYAAEDGLSAAIRLLSRDAPRLSELHLPPAVQSLVHLPHGLVLACGPTGSGKSTTLAALVQEAMRVRPRVLITLEDPLEYRLVPGSDGGLVRQREIGRHVGDFASGLRDALREDPDILLVGEMRDAETIGLALTAAETGHLVFASLHSRTSSSAVERIVDAYPPERQRQIRVQLADALRAVIAQRLVPRADGGGRVAAVEFLRVTGAVANLIREGKTPQIANALQSGRDEGMVPLERSLAELVSAGVILADAARAVVGDTKLFNDYLGAPRH